MVEIILLIQTTSSNGLLGQPSVNHLQRFGRFIVRHLDETIVNEEQILV